MGHYDEYFKSLIRLLPKDFAKWLLTKKEMKKAKVSIEDREFEIIVSSCFATP